MYKRWFMWNILQNSCKGFGSVKLEKIVLFKSLRNSKKCNKGNFTSKSNWTKLKLFGGGGQHYLVWNKISTLWFPLFDTKSKYFKALTWKVSLICMDIVWCMYVTIYTKSRPIIQLSEESLIVLALTFFFQFQIDPYEHWTGSAE